MLQLEKEAEAFFPEERWRLSYITVDPDCQGKGIGKRLVQWGLDRSEEEGSDAVLEATKAGQPLYEKLGFEVVGTTSVPTSKIQGTVMVRKARRGAGQS